MLFSSKYAFTKKIQTTGDSDDLGVGTVLMAVCVRCICLFKYGVAVAHHLQGLPSIPESWMTPNPVFNRDCLGFSTHSQFYLVKTGPWVLYLNYNGLFLYDND